MKKFLSILLTTCLFVVSIVPVMAVENNATATYLMGDVDLDGRITVKDTTLIQKFVAALEDLHPNKYAVADVDNNGNVNVKDATMIQKKIAGIINEFPVRDEESKDEVTTTPDETIPEKPNEPDVTEGPTEEPTEVPTEIPTMPTTEPVEDPTEPTTEMPTEKPTEPVTEDPTEVPTEIPTVPTTEPVEDPTEPTTEIPTEKPTEPTTEEPTEVPTEMPTEPEPTEPTTEMPTETPTEPEPTEPIIPNIETYGPIDPIEGDILTAEMLWKIEEEFFRLVNEERLAVSWSGTVLTYNKALDNGAQIRSKELTIVYDHIRPDGSICFSVIEGYNRAALGENIYRFDVAGYSGVEGEFTGSKEQLKALAKHAFEAFKESDEHYANMLDAGYENMGIGISYEYNKHGGIVICIAHILGAEKK